MTGSITTSSPAAILLKRVLGSGASTAFLVLSKERLRSGFARARQASNAASHVERKALAQVLWPT